ncbi:hypothetical protein ADK53_05035 [Streptomyces sp. WM6373]|uniref:hypothetical protein n=2 Tax=Streptomyces TaxID=1883 RepID=UPI0006AE28C2|nr:MULTISPECIES: hypothetical protein [unclassified Streptomyces]KOU43675.1 hypothetical protein ADK53_05035 [Streptomyces sp. WM6373]KOU56905.1 hypothetical protein ADK96_37400 [Streptomyces sp. IGB124]
MNNTGTTPQTPNSDPDPAQPPTTRDPAAGERRVPDAVVLVALLATCAGIYLTVGEAGFAGVISAVAALYGTWRARR